MHIFFIETSVFVGYYKCIDDPDNHNKEITGS